MGASATKPEAGATGESGQPVNNNTPKERSLKLRNRRTSKSSNPSQSPAKQRKQENSEVVAEEDSKQGREGAADGQDTRRQDGTQEEQEDFPEPPEMSEDQKVLIKDSWKALEANVAKVGIVVFIKLFETHPDVQEVFMPFRGVALEDIKHSKQLRAHALRVMGFVNKAVGRLDQPDKLLPLLKDCGKSHYYYGANINFIDLVGPQFIASIRPSMEEEDRWSDEMEQAWVLLFQHIAYQMKSSMRNEKLQ